MSKQIVHAADDNGHGTIWVACTGAYSGNMTSMASLVTCSACKVLGFGR